MVPRSVCLAALHRLQTSCSYSPPLLTPTLDPGSSAAPSLLALFTPPPRSGEHE
eukprot:CAMPEP_0118927378 /NCGR_PEP_ID=MMETSP1169-20130426/4865_1 /TAXON_ID=36882 /ORGANISM="Pyramimonas obovata, Strain CCMP722" /LENGTH=53 /DNA_ID=CAMNT_0006869125 /DNA_START=94 /DNA_END=255 /DNA_ORIENTATION=+